MNSIQNTESTFPKDTYSPKDTALEKMNEAAEFDSPLIVGGVKIERPGSNQAFVHPKHPNE